MANLPAIPAAQVPIIDPKTGQITPAWYQYLKQLDAIVRAL